MDEMESSSTSASSISKTEEKEVELSSPRSLKEGRQSETYSDGSAYHGNWKSDKRHGAGEFYCGQDKSKWIGDWEAGQVRLFHVK